MKRWCARLTSKCVSLSALLLAAMGLLAIQATPTLSKAPAQPSQLLMSLQVSPGPADEYEFKDGTVITDGAGSVVVDQNGATAPGQVDKLDLSRAASILEEQQKKAKGGQGQGGNNTFRMTITPHWFDDNTKFWYRNDNKGGTTEFILVDAEKGTRAPAFDHKKLASSLSEAAGAMYQGDKLPFQAIEFVDGGKAVRFAAGSTNWQCDLISYDCKKS